ncbi:MAG: metalloregulator ArsR/SmtB family transcription factor [Bacteroidota bacterium]
MHPPLVPDALVEPVAARLKLLADPVRLAVLNVLRIHQELSVQEILDLTGYRQANVSKHLGLLARGGIVRRRKEGVKAFYSICDPTVQGICLLVAKQVEDAQGAGVLG